jgi:Domain of unknown function (DUF4340)
MSEVKKTLIYAAVAAGLAGVAVVTAPRRVVPDAFSDRGEAFFPDFTDPNSATTLEVVDFDEETGSARPFKVTFEGGRWTIPSHHGYPADGKDRLARTAAGVIGIVKDDLRSDNVADHEACGVVDPLDQTATTLKGRGKRVTLKDAKGQVLADFIVGREPEGRSGFRFVRIPGQKRVYVARMNVDLSTKFEDWIEKDLLLVEKNDVDRLVLKDYSIDEMTGMVDQRDVVELRRGEEGWGIDRLPPGKEVDRAKVRDLLEAVDGLSIVGVRPKPEGLSASLRRVEGGMRITQADLVSLQSRGYYFTRDGRLMSNEGELQVHCKDGVTYTLRFGEIAYGTGEALTAGKPPAGEAQGGSAAGEGERGPGENRYLFISTDFTPDQPEPKLPANTDFEGKAESEWTDADRANKKLHDVHEEWKANLEKGRKRSEELNARFAGWYYVISAESFDKIHLQRKALVKAKAS